MPREETYEQFTLVGQIRHETRNAVLFVSDDDEEIWIPKSRLDSIAYEDIEESGVVHVGECVYAITIPEWLGDEKGLCLE